VERCIEERPEREEGMRGERGEGEEEGMRREYERRV
jgi:hypothetical protein